VTDPDPLVMEFEVRASTEHAFRVWTRSAGLWWPRGHTVSGDPDSIVFEPGVGGRIVERGRDGSEHQWGEITDWDEPHAVGFTWVHVFDRSQATHVRLTFVPDGSATRVRLEHTGFAALGEAGAVRRARTNSAWGAVTSAFVTDAESPSS
jgi:uncharacterized protein YndB with AHSA1/START domain